MDHDAIFDTNVTAFVGTPEQVRRCHTLARERFDAAPKNGLNDAELVGLVKLCCIEAAVLESAS